MEEKIKEKQVRVYTSKFNRERIMAMKAELNVMLKPARSLTQDDVITELFRLRSEVPRLKKEIQELRNG